MKTYEARFDNQQEARAFIRAVEWMNDGGIEIKMLLKTTRSDFLVYMQDVSEDHAEECHTVIETGTSHIKCIDERMGRILTAEQRLDHIRKHGEDLDAKYKDLMGDIATVNSNTFHNPSTGFSELYPDTPEFVREIATKRGW